MAGQGLAGRRSPATTLACKRGASLLSHVTCNLCRRHYVDHPTSQWSDCYDFCDPTVGGMDHHMRTLGEVLPAPPLVGGCVAGIACGELGYTARSCHTVCWQVRVSLCLRRIRCAARAYWVQVGVRRTQACRKGRSVSTGLAKLAATPRMNALRISAIAATMLDNLCSPR